MPPLPIDLGLKKLGVDTQGTALEVGAGLVSSALIRFRDGHCQKRGGCQRICPTQFPGTCRCLFGWTDNESNAYLALGTNQGLWIWQNCILYDITPVDHSSALAISGTVFTTTASSATVTVTDAGYSPVQGQFFNVVNAAWIDGILIQGLYQVASIGSGTYTFVAAGNGIAGSTTTDVVTYQTFNTSPLVKVALGSYVWGTGAGQNTNLQIGVGLTIGGVTIPAGLTTVAPTGTHAPSITGFGTATSNAGPTNENAGKVQIDYLLALPLEGFAAVGFGEGPYGLGPFGVGLGANTIWDTQKSLVQWSMCAWGENLLAAYAGGPIYTWTPPPAYGTAATPLGSSASCSSGTIAGAVLTVAGTIVGTFLVGQVISGGGVTVGSTIISLGTGTGGAGTYNLSLPSTVPSGVTISAPNDAPAQVNGIFIAAPQQQVFAWGAYSAALSEQDPLLLAFCDVSDNTDWTASATNQAGTFRLTSGNEIVAGTWFGIMGLIWTDNDLWAVTYLGFPLVYGFNRVSVSCGLIAPRAWAVLGTRIVWMSQHDFFIWANGQVVPMPCSVRDFIFTSCTQNKHTGLDRNYLEAIHADANTWFGEVIWRFPTVGSKGVCNAYVCWNINGQWDMYFGPQTAPFVPAEISAWVDQSNIGSGVNAPIGTDYNGFIQQFETSIDFDGQPLISWFWTGWFQIAEGTQSINWDEILPDFVLGGGNGSQVPQVEITVYVSDFLPTLNTSYPTRAYGPFPITAETPYIPCRASGRFMRLHVQCVAPNTFWRYGKPLVVAAAQERR